MFMNRRNHEPHRFLPALVFLCVPILIGAAWHFRAAKGPTGSNAVKPAVVDPSAAAHPSRTTASDRRPASANVQHGKYLVRHVAMCIICHTPKTRDGQLIETRLLHGAPIPVKNPYSGPRWALTAPRLAGLPGGWDQAALVRFLQTGKTPSGDRARSPMPPFRMSAKDARDVAAYLKSLDGN